MKYVFSPQMRTTLEAIQTLTYKTRTLPKPAAPGMSMRVWKARSCRGTGLLSVRVTTARTQQMNGRRLKPRMSSTPWRWTLQKSTRANSKTGPCPWCCKRGARHPSAIVTFRLWISRVRTANSFSSSGHLCCSILDSRQWSQMLSALRAWDIYSPLCPEKMNSRTEANPPIASPLRLPSCSTCHSKCWLLRYVSALSRTTNTEGIDITRRSSTLWAPHRTSTPKLWKALKSKVSLKKPRSSHSGQSSFLFSVLIGIVETIHSQI